MKTDDTRPTRVDVYSALSATSSFRLYHSDLRRLLGLPQKSGQFTAVRWENNRLVIDFERITNKCRNLEII